MRERWGVGIHRWSQRTVAEEGVSERTTTQKPTCRRKERHPVTRSKQIEAADLERMKQKGAGEWRRQGMSYCICPAAVPGCELSSHD